MKKIYLVFRVYFVNDEVNGDGKYPLWCCYDESKAISSVKSLNDEFLKDKERLALKYDVKHDYELITLC